MEVLIDVDGKKSNLGVMLNQSSSSSTKNYIDVCGEISECNNTAASQQRLLSGGTGSRQLKQEEPIAAATSVCAITNDTPNMSTNDEVRFRNSELDCC
uniref:Uncharacterized protein n=1 Tax=Elaeophora elaphi TaxID=1147741 RepID=A0A0R3RRA9_9BILA